MRVIFSPTRPARTPLLFHRPQRPPRHLHRPSRLPRRSPPKIPRLRPPRLRRPLHHQDRNRDLPRLVVCPYLVQGYTLANACKPLRSPACKLIVMSRILTATFLTLVTCTSGATQKATTISSGCHWLVAMKDAAVVEHIKADFT